MKRANIAVSAMGLAMLAGLASAQPTVDGQKDALYGTALWVNTTATQFGDNNPANVPPSGNASSATTGIELVIPLSAIGNPAGSFRLAGWVTSGDHTFMSNQMIGGLPNVGNIGNPPKDFNTVGGQQWITITPAAVGTAPTVDGSRDAGYGTAQDGWAQGNYTGFGDATHGNVDGGGGSEIDQVFAVTNGGNLYLMITGNLEANGNGLALFFDTVGGGQNELFNTNPSVDNPSGSGQSNVLNAMAGYIFDTGFDADYFIDIAGRDTDGLGNFALGAHFANLNAGTEAFLGSGTYASSGALTGADGGAPAAQLTINNSNTMGVTGAPPFNVPNRDLAVGSEFDAVYAYIDTNDDVYVMITGNIESNFNKIVLFFDSQTGGQNQLRGDNVDISFNRLNRLGNSDQVGMSNDGLILDEGFEADSWWNINIGGDPARLYVDGAVLRTDGPRETPNENHLDYGCYSSEPKGSGDPVLPVTFSGNPDTRCDIQDDFTANIFSNYAPRLSGDSVFNNFFDPINFPTVDCVTGQLEVYFDNSNIAGVSDVSGSGGESVTTGLEFKITAAELGWDGTSPLKLAGFITNGDINFLSNQIIGGGATDNLGEPRGLDFNTLTGDQFVILNGGPSCPSCTADFDNSGGAPNSSDFLAYLNAYSSQDPCADLAAPLGSFNSSDFLAFLNAYSSGC
ncbi:MAG: GC-type dockerin domain-anchored protein [Phycisphaerales bacterium]|nr:GC-type dockerin domain-anchored protein [Phycisphaerales bacterium]